MPIYKLKSGKHYERNSSNQLGRCLVPGDTIECEEYQLGGALDKFECISGNVATMNTKVVQAQLYAKRIRSRKNTGISVYNVFYPNGTQLNDQPLTKEEAEEIIGNAILESD